MTKRMAIWATMLATCSIALAYCSAFVEGGTRWGVWCMIFGLATMIVALMALGVSRRDGGVGKLALPLAFTFVIIVGGFASALLLPGDDAASRVVLGLPLRAALVLYGVGVLPILILPLSYALTFDDMTLSEDDLKRAQALGAEHAATHGRTGH